MIKNTSEERLIYSLMCQICSSDHSRSSSVKQKLNASGSHTGIEKQPPFPLQNGGYR